MTSRNIFKQTCLPSMSEFYSKLKMEGITVDEYKRAQEMCDTYKCENMQDFHDVYIKLDVVLLADCMENFRRTRIWNRSGSLLDVSRVHMAMLFKDDKFRITADNRSERLSYVRKCNKRWCVDR